MGHLEGLLLPNPTCPPFPTLPTFFTLPISPTLPCFPTFPNFHTFPNCPTFPTLSNLPTLLNLPTLTNLPTFPFYLLSNFTYFFYLSQFSFFFYISYFSYISCLVSSGAFQNISQLWFIDINHPPLSGSPIIPLPPQGSRGVRGWWVRVLPNDNLHDIKCQELPKNN